MDKDALIIEYMPVASNIARKYARYVEFKDIEAEAFLGLVEAVNRIEQGKCKHENHGGYINKYITQYCHNYLKKFGYNSNISYDDITEDKHSSFNKTDFDDTIESITQTEQEKQVITLRRQGLNDTEISEQLGLDRLTIRKIRKRLYNRFERLWN